MTTPNPFLGMTQAKKRRSSMGRPKSNIPRLSVYHIVGANQQVEMSIRLSLPEKFLLEQAPEFTDKPAKVEVFLGESHIGIHLKDDGEYVLGKSKDANRRNVFLKIHDYESCGLYPEQRATDVKSFEKVADGCFIFKF